MKIKPIYSLLFFIVVVICYRIFGYTGHFGFDDMQYAEIASNLLNGNVDFEDHFTFRFTIIAATALSYKLFGINDFASSFPAMTLTLLILIVVYAVLHKRGFWATAVGLAMTATSQWMLFYSNKLMPDIYLVFFTLLAAYIYYHYRYVAQKHTLFHAALFAVALLFGFLSKGTVVLLIPWLLYLLISDCFLKKDFRFWIGAIGTGTVCLIIYFVCIRLLTGEFLHRFKAIAANSYLNLCSYDQQPLPVLLKRLFFDFFDMTIVHGYAVPLVFVTAAFFSKGWRNILKMTDATAYFIISAMALFLSSNFMTISATSYVPMCIDPRHYLFIIPIASIAAALFILKKPHSLSIYLIAGIFILLCIYSFFDNQNLFYYLYLPIAIVTTATAICHKKDTINPYLAGAMLLATMVFPIRAMTVTAPSYEYNERRNLLIDNVINDKQSELVVSDKVCTRMMRYYNGFSANDKYLDFNNLDEESLNNHQGKITLVLNDRTIELSSMTYDDLPDYASVILAQENPILDKYSVKLYRLDHLELKTQLYDTLFQSVNHFDSTTPNYWREGYELSHKTSFSRQQSNKVGMYSATFSYPIDSLRGKGCDTVYLCISANCNCYKKTNCAVVVSVENSDKNFSWNSYGIEKRLKAYSHWYPFQYKQAINPNQFPTGAMVLVYFYKTDETDVFIDDFDVSFCRKKH